MNQNIKNLQNKAQLILVIIFFQVILAISAFKIDLDKTIIQKNNQWTRIKLNFINGTSPYQIYYDVYPRNWNQIINYIYIPSSQLKNNSKFPCRISVQDGKGQQIKVTIVFLTRESKIFLADSFFKYQQIFDDAFYETGVFSGKPQFVIVNGSSISDKNFNNSNNDFVGQEAIKKIGKISQMPGAGFIQVLDVLDHQNKTLAFANFQTSMKIKDQIINQNFSSSESSQPNSIQQAAKSNQNNKNSQPIVDIQNLSQNQWQLLFVNNIKNSRASQIIIPKLIQNIFNKLPGPQQLDSIIITGDAYALVKTIQQVITSNLTCEQKISYLSDFFGRIKSAINIKSFTITQLGIIINSAKIQIQALNKQIQFKKDQINKLNIINLRSKLNSILVQLNKAYDNFNNNVYQIQNKRSLVTTYQQNIQDIKNKREKYKKTIPIQQLQLQQVSDLNRQLIKQQEQALLKRQKAQNDLQKINKTVAVFDAKIQEDQNKTNILQAKIKETQNNKQKVKSNYKELQVLIQNQKTFLINQQKILAESKAFILNLQLKAQIQKQKMDNTQINKIKDLINNLKNIQSNVSSSVNQINYKCTQIFQITAVKQNSSIIYSIIPKEYSSYIQKYYKIQPSMNNLNSNNIKVNSFGILDNKWVSQFGNPYPATSYAKSTQFSFDQDFSCVAVPQLQSNSGVIKTENLGITFKLNLGACSRIESPTSIPKIGQKIYFRGTKQGKTEYNLYKASCI